GAPVPPAASDLATTALPAGRRPQPVPVRPERPATPAHRHHFRPARAHSADSRPAKDRPLSHWNVRGIADREDSLRLARGCYPGSTLCCPTLPATTRQRF